jgi:LysM repeat protein
LADLNQALVETLPSAEVESQPEPVTHIVQPGDNLFRISLAYGIAVEDIMQANNLTGEGLIYSGQALLIPSEMANSPETTQNLEGDTLPPMPTTNPVTDTSAQLTETPPSPTETPSPAETPTPTPPILTTVNGIPLESFLLMPTDVLENSRAIYSTGQALGRNSRAFSKVGDSTIENPHFLARFDEGPYNLGEYAYLQGVIDHFAGSHSRQGLAVRRGNHSWTVTDPLWADKSSCQPNETPIDCEIRVHNPSILIIRLGSNDRGVPSGFEHNLRQVVQIAIDNGVIPVLGTKADRFEGSNINNDIIRRIASDFQVPLWDYDMLASTIPGRGLDVDAVHLTTFYAHDYTSTTAYQRGHGVHNLTALMVLDAIWKEIIQGSSK